MLSTLARTSRGSYDAAPFGGEFEQLIGTGRQHAERLTKECTYLGR